MTRNQANGRKLKIKCKGRIGNIGEYRDKLIKYNGAWKNFLITAKRAKTVIDEAKKASKIAKDIPNIYGK